MNWRRSLFRCWLVLSLCWIVAVSVFAWKQEPWVLASSQEFVFEGITPGTDQSDPITLNLGGKRVEVERRFLLLSPEKQKQTVEEIVNHLNSEAAKRYAAYVLLPPLATLVLGLVGAWVVSVFARGG
jgi:hypothetical protein